MPELLLDSSAAVRYHQPGQFEPYHSTVMPSLGIVIVNYRTPEMLRDCLRSIEMSEGVSPSVCVVDNASGDGSAEMVRREFPAAALYVQAENRGYAHANNIGLRHFGFG